MWYFVMSGAILVAVGIALFFVRQPPEEAQGLRRYVNLAYAWPFVVILFGLLSVALGLGILPWPRWR